jgi:hypothetical protein
VLGGVMVCLLILNFWIFFFFFVFTYFLLEFVLENESKIAKSVANSLNRNIVGGSKLSQMRKENESEYTKNCFGFPLVKYRNKMKENYISSLSSSNFMNVTSSSIKSVSSGSSSSVTTSSLISNPSDNLPPGFFLFFCS